MSARVDGREFRKSLDELRTEMYLAAVSALEYAAAAGLTSAAATTLYKDGPKARLRKQTTAVINGPAMRVDLKNTAKYALYVEGGTAPHIIKARKRKALRFVSDGHLYFRKSVMHPGTKPRPFMRIAGEAGVSALNSQLESVISAAILRS